MSWSVVSTRLLRRLPALTLTSCPHSLCAVDFVLGPSQESLLQAFERWKGWADEKVCCDYAFHVGVTWWSPQVAMEMEVLCQEKGQYSTDQEVLQGQTHYASALLSN